MGIGDILKDGVKVLSTIGVPGASIPGMGIKAAEQAKNIVTEPEEAMSSFERFNSFLGTESGSALKDIGGGFLSDFRQRRNTRKNFDFLRGRGLTPSQIGAQGTVQSQGNTLGNGPAKTNINQLEFQREQAALDREAKLEIARIEHGDRQDKLDIERALGAVTMNIGFQQEKNLRETARKIAAEVEKLNFENRNRFNLLFANMGPDNVVVSLAAALQGISPERILATNGKALTRDERERVKNVLQDVRQGRGFAGQTVWTVQDIINRLISGSDFRGKNTPPYWTNKPEPAGEHKPQGPNTLGKQ